MPIGNKKIIFIRPRFASGFLLPAESFATDQVPHLTTNKDHYFLGPYLYYLEDLEKKLTIRNVSSSQMSDQFFKHAGKLLNLGLNSNAYWIRFTVAPSRTQDPQKKWLLFFGWPNSIDDATLYIPKISEPGWIVKKVGRILPTGPDPLPSRPADFLPPNHIFDSITIYLRVESSDIKQIPLQILTDEAYQRRSNWRSLWFGAYYGIILAMFLYNLILFTSMRELNRLYYLFYLLSMVLLYLGSNGMLWEVFKLGSNLNRVLILIFICFAFFWAIFFAKSFLIADKHAPVFDKILSVFMIYSIVLAAMIPFVNSAWMTFAVLSQGIFVPPVFPAHRPCFIEARFPTGYFFSNRICRHGFKHHFRNIGKFWPVAVFNSIQYANRFSH